MMRLSSLLVSDRPTGTPVALVNGQLRTLADFRGDVAGLVAQLDSAEADRICLYSDCTYRFAVGLFAGLHAGKSVLLLPNAQPQVLTSSAGDDGLLLSEVAPPEGLRHLALRIDQPGSSLDFVRLDPEACSLEFFTSGSTGEAKPIAKRLFQLEEECVVLEKTWGDEIGGMPVLATVSHQHIYGMLFRVLWPLLAGRPFIAETHLYWETLVAALTGPSVIVSSPAHLSRFPPQLEITPQQLPGKVFSSGGPLGFEAAQTTLHHLGALPVEVFGSTETGGIAYRSQGHPNAPWRCFKGVEVKSGPEGHLAVRSAFLDCPDWFETSDLADFESDQYFRLKGRSDRIIKVEGKRVSLAEVEQALTSDDWVRAAAVVQLDDDRQSLAAVIEPSDAGNHQLQASGPFRFSRDIRRRLGDSLEAAARPKRWRFVERLPENAQGKRSLAQIRSLFDKNGPRADEVGGDKSAWLRAETMPQVMDIRRDGNSLDIDLGVSPTLFQFQGHFPDQAVLPGVAQIDWAVYFAKLHFGLHGDPAAITQLKFRNLLLPDTTVTLSLEWQPDRERVKFRMACGEVIHSSGLLKMGDA
ncbi:MAG: AMP-binding protein [Magnetovibrionaceae bacterium]